MNCKSEAYYEVLQERDSVSYKYYFDLDELHLAQKKANDLKYLHDIIDFEVKLKIITKTELPF